MSDVANEPRSGNVEDLTHLSDAISYVAVKLHKQLAKKGKNVFFSPFSIATAMSMVLHGARGATAEEMETVLGFKTCNVPLKEVTSQFGDMLNALGQDQEDYILSFANSLLAHKEFLVKEDYKKDLLSYFRAMLMEVDFEKEAEATVERINNWVSDNTNTMITKLIEKLDPETVLVILNAVYFKGSWLRQFDKARTHLQPFYHRGDDSKATEIPMMHISHEFFYVEKETYKALQIPYKGNDIAMLLVLPNGKNGLSDLEDALTPSFFKDLKKQLRKEKVDVALPKFRMEYSVSLNAHLQTLGMRQIFRAGADLGGINDSDKLCVSDVVHKAVLEVNEEGSEAAAVTQVAITFLCREICPEFVADHPFLYVIINTKNDLLLFMGRVEDLS